MFGVLRHPEGGTRGTVGAGWIGAGHCLGYSTPRQPFIAAAALVAGIVKGLIPSGKETFGREQDEALRFRAFDVPKTMERNYDFAAGGDSVDYERRAGRGLVRVEP